MKLEYSREIFEKDPNKIFKEIRPVGKEMLHAD
jgi:hypothetical protein